METKRAGGMCVCVRKATLRYHPLTATRSLRTKSCSVGSPRWPHGETNESLCESCANLTCPRAATKAISREERSEEVEHGRVASRSVSTEKRFVQRIWILLVILPVVVSTVRFLSIFPLFFLWEMLRIIGYLFFSRNPSKFGSYLSPLLLETCQTILAIEYVNYRRRSFIRTCEILFFLI